MKKLFFVFFTLLAYYAEAQLDFDFEDQNLPDCEQLPPGSWGLDSSTTISGNFSLHHVHDNSEAGRDRLSWHYPLNLSDSSFCWRFQVKYDYPPSGSNNWGFFITADKNAEDMHPSGDINGYLAGVNYSGSDDKIKLWRVASGSGYEILNTGFNWQENIAPGQTVGFEIIRKEPGIWKMRIDTNGLFDHLYEIGRIQDSSYQMSEYTGIYHEYTSSADRKLWFDDIYVGPVIKDTLPPIVNRQMVIHSRALQLCFSEALDSSSMTVKSNYTLLNSDNRLEEVAMVSNHPATIQLSYEKPFGDSLEYFLEVIGLVDLSGNLIHDTTVSFMYNKLRVNDLEVQSKDTIRVSFSRKIDSISAGKTGCYRIVPDIGEPDTIIFPDKDLEELMLITSTSLEPGKKYKLRIGGVKDEYYDPMVPFETVLSYSFTRAYDVVINEIMADPFPPVGLPEAEYIELYNRKNDTLDLSGWSLLVDQRKKPFPDSRIGPYGYLILADEEYYDTFASHGITVPFQVFPVLKNSESAVALYNSRNRLIDSLFYTDSWYGDSEKKNGGYSLERIDPENHCSGMTNWKATIDEKGGTPGQRNSVYAENHDTLPPGITFFEAMTNYQLRIKFSEPLAEDIAGKESNYKVNHGLGHPFSVVLNKPDNNEVLLLFSERFRGNLDYELTIETLSDLCENKTGIIERKFVYHPERPYDVVINEIMNDPNPSVSLPDAEYVELYNRSGFEISLSRWWLIAGKSSVQLGDFSLLPGEYCIVCEDSLEKQFSGYGSVLPLENMPNISDKGEPLILENDEDAIISYIPFEESWYGDEYKQEGGWSLEQVDPDNPCGREENWKASCAEKGGTPGIKNSVYSENPDLIPIRPKYLSVVDSMNLVIHFNEPYDRYSVADTEIYRVPAIGHPAEVVPVAPGYKSLQLSFDRSFKPHTRYSLEIKNKVMDCAGNLMEGSCSLEFEMPQKANPGDLVINEVLFNPLNNGVDFVEVYNRSSRTIDLKEICMASVDEDAEITGVESIVSEGRMLFPGEIMVYTTRPSVVKQQYHVLYPDRFVVTESFPSFPNDAGTVLLVDKWKQIIDRFDYTEDMHFALLKNTDGVTLERVHPERPSGDRTNWQSASHTCGYGTPTYRNSQYSEESADESLVSVTPEVFSPDNDGKDDVVNIHYNFSGPGNVVTVRIYDSRGRVIRRLVNNRTVDTRGFFSWDGMDDDGRKAKMGIYVIFVELYNLEGKVRSFKLPCVVAGRL
jgi:hypothetical protein